MLARPRQVLKLGHPVLAQICAPVGSDDLTQEKRELCATLDEFRLENGFGRAIAAPQIGVPRRFVALNLGDEHGTRVLSDPQITWRSAETMTLWDDCLSLPWVLCKVRRHTSISVSFTDENGDTCLWPELGPSTSELLQHELDHLDGTLITDRMLEAREGDEAMMVSRDEYERARDEFDAAVDFAIIPTT